RDAGQHELLARRADQLGGVGDAIGLGDEPARDRVAVDALGEVVVHGASYHRSAPPEQRTPMGTYSAAASLWFCAAAILARARSSPRRLATAAPPPAVSVNIESLSMSSSSTGVRARSMYS